MRNARIDVPRDRVIGAVLAEQAQQVGDELFLLDEDGDALTYAQADDTVNRYANGLAALGVARGDRVALLMENSAVMVLCCFAVNRLGAVWSPINTDYRGTWLVSTLAAARARVLIVDEVHLRELETFAPLPCAHIVVNGTGPAGTRALAEFDEHPRTPPQITLDYGDTSAIIWTSGTTGPSKGVLQPHNVWLAWAEYHNRYYRDGVRPGERFYTCAPLYNSAAWISSVFPALITGLPACIDRRFSVTRFWERVRHYRATHVMMLGTMHLYLWRQPTHPNDRDNTLRTVAMMPLLSGVVEDFKARFGIERVSSGFGQSEVLGATTWFDDMELSQECSGLIDSPGSLVEVSLLGEDDAPVPTGRTGEICVRGRGPYVIFSGYADDPQATSETWRNLWHHTGDLGRTNAGGELFFVDRKKDSTRHKGRNISSYEVETVARGHPDVAVAAVVGVRTAEFESEDELLLTVVPAELAKIDPLALCQYIDANAPYFFVPRFVHVTQTLPLTPTQKVQKHLLRERGVPPNAWDMLAQEWRPKRRAAHPPLASTQQ